MQLLRPIAVFLSVAAHAAIGLAFVTSEPAMTAFDEGDGSDAFSTELTVSIEGSSMLGGMEEVVEAMDIAPVQEAVKAEPVETEEPELKDIVTAAEAPTEAPMEIEKPEEVKEEKPVEMSAVEVAPTVAAEQQSVGSKASGGDITARRAYMGEVAKKLHRNKVNPRSQLTGTVLLRFTLDPRGEILTRTVYQSSGSKVLDDAAIAALERSAPFPPLPNTIASGPLEMQVPFRFLTR
jgi:protein TonB